MKTTTFLKSLTLAAAAFFFGACQQYYIETQPEVPIKMDTDVREAYTISGTNPQPATFSIASTTPWEITGYESAEWLSVKPASSALSSLSTDVTLTAVPNDTYEDRSVTLTLKGEGIDKVWTIEVTQVMKNKFYVQPITEEFEGKTENSLTFTIETNLAWEVRSADTWLTFDKTNGTGTGAIETITATAAENPGTERTTTVTVTAGADVFTFDVLQKGGKTLEFVTEELEMLSYAGGVALLDVNASMDWTVTSDAEWLAVENAGTQVKATAAANNGFAERKAVVTIEGDGLTAEFEITQDTPYLLEGSVELLADGSVKITGAEKGRVYIKDRLTHFSAVLEIAEINWGAKGEFWFFNMERSDFGNWMTQGKMRLRDYLFQSSNAYYDDMVTPELLNSMKTYEFAYKPEQLYFAINGQEIQHYDIPECPFTEEAPDLGEWFFGFYNAVSDDTYYVVKSCTITPIAE